MFIRLKQSLQHTQFGYCPLNRTLNNKINRVHERALRIVYRDKTWNITKLLQKDNAVTVHQRNLHVLATEIYKVKMGFAPQLVKELFPLSTHAYNLRSNKEYKLEDVNTVHWILNRGFQKIVLAGSVKPTFIT